MASALPATTQQELQHKTRLKSELERERERRVGLVLLVERIAISLVIHGHKVHHADVRGMWIEASDAHLKGGEHPSARLRDDHFGALRMELIPQRLRLQHHNGLCQRWMHRLRFLHKAWQLHDNYKIIKIADGFDYNYEYIRLVL